ncbi:MAG: hypothetical protein COB56_03265 [Robiginitomaculum sp.]|nr:MAG: hypothetical protein COB56_03265 [Robiginitomaculum sp.]
MAELDKIVNNIIGTYDRSLSTMAPGMANYDSWIRDRGAITELFNEVKHLRSITKPVPKTLGDLSDLPDELKAELSAIKTDDLEDQIFTIINAAGGEANIDTILVELFRRFNLVQKRTYITNKLWRMTQKDGLLWAADGKGIYTTKEPNSLSGSGAESDNTPNDISKLDTDLPF